MSYIDESLREILRLDAGVSAIVGSAIHMMRLPQGTKAPCISYSRVNTNPINALNTAARAEISTYQFDAWGKTQLQARDLAHKIKLALDAYVGTVLGVAIGGIMLANEVDLYEEDTEFFRVSLDFTVMYRVG